VADVNRCPPGGDETIAALAELTGRAKKPLDPDCGEYAAAQVALIDEDTCIGCTRCIQACPVDAITGAAKRMHTVIAAECTGCELCLPPCPVDCIDLVKAWPDTAARPAPAAGALETLRRRHITARDRRAADHARQRHEARERRLGAARERREAKRRDNRAAKAKMGRRAEIADMVAAVRARRERPESKIQ
jgi:electron transport complex protein RnfB